MSPRRRKIAFAALVVAVLVAGVVVILHRSASPAAPITVMTRNVYLGGDIMRPIEATAGKAGADALVSLGNANYELREIVDRTDFPTRATLLAAEIATNQPDLVGLQEVALWRRGPVELTPGVIGVPNATTVDYDYLQILTDALADAGMDYQVVSEQPEADVEAPAFTGNPLTGTMSAASDVRLTVRDVILLRVDDGLELLDSGGGQYETRLPVSVAGLPLAFVRGYTWADVRTGSTELRFVNTHLESASADVALGQAGELLAGPAAKDGDTIVVCDCNSNPLSSSDSGAYDAIVGGGFTDEWLQWAPADQGWTSGLSELVDDTTADGFDHRIDMVFARSADSSRLDVDRGEITGDQVSDRDRDTGLWPSDHAGVVLRLQP